MPFAQGASIPLYDNTTASGLQRQADGSLTKHTYQNKAPYNQVSTTPNYQETLQNCSGEPTRTIRNPTGWVPLADQPGAPARTIVFADLIGNGTPVGLATVPGVPPGPAVDSLVAALSNPDGSLKSSNYYPIAPSPSGLLVTELNHDGKKDVVVVSYGNGTGPTVTVFLGNGDGTLKTGVRYTAHNGSSSAVAADLNGDGHIDLAVTNFDSQDLSILIGNGDGTFKTAVNYPLGVYPSSVTVADFNGDGKPDLCVGANGSVNVLLGNGNGVFGTPSQIRQNFHVEFVSSADFNKDGKPDLLVGGLDGTTSVLLGDGTGKFPSQQNYADGYHPGSMMPADIDGDGNLDAVTAAGHPDVLTPDAYTRDVRVNFGKGDGTFTGAPVHPVSQDVSAIAPADFNGDGKTDLAVAATEPWILTGKGDGTFNTPGRFFITNPGSSSFIAGLSEARPKVSAPAANALATTGLTTGDFNGDGKQDLVIGDNAGDGVFVMLGKGDGTFQAQVRYPVGGPTASVAKADFNGDGRQDIVAVGGSLSTGGNAGILLGNADGTFQSIRKLTGAGVMPQFVVTGDFNKDGKQDLAIANAGNSTGDNGGILVFLGNGDGTFQAAVSYTAFPNPTRLALGDLNGDGVLDLATVDSRQISTDPKVGILLGNANGTFRTMTTLATDFGPSWITVADINSDNKLDLVVSHCCGYGFTTFRLGNGDGTFKAEEAIRAASSTASVAVVDLNGDKKPDIISGIQGVTSDRVWGYVTVALGGSAGTPAPNPLTNVNGASFLTGALAPDSFATAQGTKLSIGTAQSGSPYPTTLSGTTVKIKDSQGVERLAGLAYVSPTQVNYIVPSGTALGTATITVTASDGTISQSTQTIASVGTGIFLFGGTNLAAANVLRVKPDYSQIVEDVYQISGSNLVPKPIDLGPDTDQVYLVLYATGLRGASQSNVTVSANGVNMPILYAGLQPQYPGLDQIDALIPRSLIGKGDVTITVTVNGQAANTSHVTIK